MKLFRTIFASVAILALILSCFYGCQKADENNASESASPEPTASQAESTQPDVSPDDTPEDEPAAEITKPGNPNYTSETVIATVNGENLYWDEYKYWLASSLIYGGYDPSSETDWDEELYEGFTFADYVKMDALDSVKLYRAVNSKAREMNISLTEEDIANINDVINSQSAQFETEEEYKQYLKDNYLSEELIRYLLESSCYYYNIFVDIYGANGEKLSDDDVYSFADEYQVLRAKHILMSNKDGEGNTLSDEEMEEKLNNLVRMKAAIEASDDPVETFHSVMVENSEDPGVVSNEDGYQFTTGYMASSFEETINGLKDYEISDIVDIGYGYSLIMRLPLDPEQQLLSYMGSGSLRYSAANAAFQNLTGTWSSELEVVPADALNDLVLSEWF